MYPLSFFKVANSLEDLVAMGPKQSAVTLGVFDGIHRGHRRIIDSLIHCKDTGSARSCYLITFDPHPVVVTHSRIMPPVLTTIEERISLLRTFPLDGVLVIHFDPEVADTDYRVFLDKYLLKALDMKVLLLGYDCHFGRNREGTPERVSVEAKKKGFQVRVIPPVKRDGEIVSSSVIRNKLLKGDLEKANDLLGHPYTIAGRVIRGHGMGRTIGFPTANLTIENPVKLWPPGGVYAVSVQMGEKFHHGMMNIGKAPTLKQLQDGMREIEVHIFEFNEDLYDQNLIVHCHAFLREERPFPSAGALIEQLESDKKEAMEVLKKTQSLVYPDRHCAQ